VSFAFLNPWLWLGVAAVAAPIWLHLQRKKERNLVRFAAVQFLDHQPKARGRPLRVRNVLLLLLRALAVFLVVGAFSWPYLRRNDRRFATRNRVYVLDNSLSRQANDGFNRDKQRIVHDLSAAGPDTRIAVLNLAGTPQLVVGFSDDRQVAMEKVRELKASFGRGSYLDGIQQANALLAEVGGGAKQIVFLGDSQANQWQESLTTAPFLRQVQVELPKSPIAQLPNLWLCEPRAQRIFLGETSRVNFTMRLGHLGPARSAKVTLRANGRKVYERNVYLEGQPQTMSLQAQCEADPTAWLLAQAEVDGSPDSLPGDNHLYFAVPPVVEGRVALLARSPYLRLGLAPDVMRGQWRVRLLDPSSLEAELSAEPESDVLCLESAYLQGPEGRSILKRYLEAGRGVLLLVNRLSPVIDVSLRELGFECEGVFEPGTAKPEHFQFVSSNHSIFHPFESPDFGNLMEVTVSRYARLRATAGHPLILSESGSGLFFESTKYPGKLYIMAFGLDREETSWPVHQTFIPFLDLALQAARPQDFTLGAFQPGEMGIIQLGGEPPVGAVVLRDKGVELGRVPVNRARASLPMPDKPGIYGITLDDRGEIYRFISVNPSPRESELVYLQSPRVPAEWSVGERDRTDPSGATEAGRVGFSSILKQHIWWWMVLLGLLALALETTWTLAKENSFE